MAHLGPAGPHPQALQTHELDRRWLHYAFRSDDGGLTMIANLSTLGATQGPSLPDPQQMSILLVHDREGWAATQFNARVTGQPWSSFRLPDHGPTLRIAAPDGLPSVDLTLNRTGRPCTSQCAPFGGDQHLRWQSEPGVVAAGTVTGPAGRRRKVAMVGYHERVRGRWSWPMLGGWVFGFANAPAVAGSAPPISVVFTLIQPRTPADAATGSVMVWRHGRLLRHFSRRALRVGVSGLLPRDDVTLVPALAATLGTPSTAPVPGRLAITARTADDALDLDIRSVTACRIVNPNEVGLAPFSVHEVLGPCRISGRVAGQDVDFEAPAVVEFAGGADVD